MRHGLTLAGKEYDVSLSRTATGYCLHWAGQSVAVDLVTDEAGRQLLHCDGQVSEIHLASHGDELYIHLQGRTWQLHYRHPLTRLAQASGAAAQDRVTASMPGSIVALEVGPGDAVAAGQTLLVMESMKMETTVAAHRDAVIAEVHVAMGESFDKDALLVSFEEQSA